MSIPIPPGSLTLKTTKETQIPRPVQQSKEPAVNSVVEIKSTNRVLPVDEETIEEVLQRVLKPVHATDPNVLRFIHNYLYTRNKKQAARLSGLNARDGHNLLARRDIYLAIQEVTAKAVQKNGYDAEEVIERVKDIAFIDPADCQNPDGSFIDKLNDMPTDVRQAIRRMKVKNIYEKDANGMLTGTVEGKVIEIEFWDKMKATELLGRDKGIFKEKKVVEHDVSANMREILLASRARAQGRIASMRDVGPMVDKAIGGDDGNAE